MSTYSPKASEITREWHVVDADGLVLGRLASEVANILRGKHKPTYAPHIDTGDHVISVNADKVVLTGGKADKKLVHRHSGYPGGIKSENFERLMARKPGKALEIAVKGMLPRGPLGRTMFRKLRVFAGETHNHAAQKPEPLDIGGAA